MGKQCDVSLLCQSHCREAPAHKWEVPNKKQAGGIYSDVIDFCIFCMPLHVSCSLADIVSAWCAVASTGILCMDNYDITNDGVLDLIVSRDDGLVEIYGYDETDDPVFRYSHVSHVTSLTLARA